MHHLIERQVLDTPDDPAVWAAGQTVTYAELNTRANQLTHHLCKLGVGPNKLVGVYVERSVEMGVALLAIFKAGGVYVLAGRWATCKPMSSTSGSSRCRWGWWVSCTWAVSGWPTVM